MAVALLVMSGALCACSGVCGPGDAPGDGLVGTTGDTTIRYGQFTSSRNNDCTQPGAPTSITLDGIQVAPMPADINMHLTFCLPRPHELGRGPVSLADTRLIEVIDVFAALPDGCILALDRSAPVPGTIELEGYCDGGLDPGGYALHLHAEVPMINTCTQAPAPALSLRGAVAVEALPH